MTFERKWFVMTFSPSSKTCRNCKLIETEMNLDNRLIIGDLSGK